jgi:hypothetical protein
METIMVSASEVNGYASTILDEVTSENLIKFLEAHPNGTVEIEPDYSDYYRTCYKVTVKWTYYLDDKDY